MVSANGSPARTFSLKTGQELELTLQSIGPGDYASPPLISTAAVKLLDVTVVGPHVPAGVTQRFRFSAVSPGEAVITFQHSGNDSTIQDTVDIH
jgi:hypothetical protein